MIRVGSSDAGKLGLGLGFCGEERAVMAETELEEGETCSYNEAKNGDDYDDTIDPDVALSYIDEKLHDVLGHFQKDFEGGVFADNLGAKYGGYGSFLPAYQRSPVWSNSKSPSEVQKNNAPSFSSNSHSEDGHHNVAASVKEGYKNGYFNQEGRTEECHPNCESSDNKFDNLPNQKLLKVRIKVGSGNLSTQNKAAIYSGLGLNMSPSSSLDDSPSEGEGTCRHPGVPYESPRSILQIMTSFPVLGDVLLSPLPDNLTNLSKLERPQKNHVSASVSGTGATNSGMSVHNSSRVKVGRNYGEEKKVQPIERTDLQITPRKINQKEFRNGTNENIWKEEDIDMLACEDLVSRTLKLPLISKSYTASEDRSRNPSYASDGPKEVSRSNWECISNKVYNELLKPGVFEEARSIEKPKNNGARRIFDRRIGTSSNGSFHPKKENCSTQSVEDKIDIDVDVHNGKTTANAELSDDVDPMWRGSSEKASSENLDRLASSTSKKDPSYEVKRKSKERQMLGTVETDTKVGLSDLPFINKSKKINEKNSKSKGVSEDFKVGKDRYQDFFGDMDLEEDNDLESLAMPTQDLQGSAAAQKSILATDSASKKSSNIKKMEKMPAVKGNSAAPFNVSASARKVAPHASLPPSAPAIVEDNWVQCDNCQKRRLLPLGTCTTNLPEKWICAMLDWLPSGSSMNHCSVSQDETTKALLAQGQVPAVESGKSIVADASAKSLTSHSQADQLQEVRSLQGLPGGGQEKNEIKKASSPANVNDALQVSDSIKKNAQVSAKSKPSDISIQNSPKEEPELEKLSNCSGINFEKCGHEDKVPGRTSHGGDGNISSSKGKRDLEHDYPKLSKKVKSKDRDDGDDYLTSDCGGIMGSTSHGSPTSIVGKNDYKSEHSPSRSSKFGMKDKDKSSVKRPREKDQVSLDYEYTEVQNSSDRDNGTKQRKTTESQSGHRLKENRVPAGKNEYSLDKKINASMSRGKESRSGKGSDRSNKEGGENRNMLPEQILVNKQSQQSMACEDLMRREQVTLQSSIAATSSSSKVSGSHRSKGSLQEIRSSPVESVSSSPMRNVKVDAVASSKPNTSQKEYIKDSGIIDLSRSKRHSEGEDGRTSDQSVTGKRHESIVSAPRGSHESSVIDPYHDNFSGSHTKTQIVPSPDITNSQSLNHEGDNVGHDTQHHSGLQGTSSHGSEAIKVDKQIHANSCNGVKVENASASLSKDKPHNPKYECDRDKGKMTDSFDNAQRRRISSEVKPKDGRRRSLENSAIKHEAGQKSDDKGFSDKSVGNSKRGSHLNSGVLDDQDSKPDVKSSEDAKCNGNSKDASQAESVSARRKPIPACHVQHNGIVNGTTTAMLTSSSQKPMVANTFEGNDTTKLPRHMKKADIENQQNGFAPSTSNRQRSRETDASKDSASQAATKALKEAKDLKHMADRLKNSGSGESTGLYFQAALKFLHGASLLESSTSESSKRGEMAQSMQIYSSTAKLCEFCAHEYEKSKDMASAALVYKCMEVAYMKVVSSSHNTASQYRRELQRALQMLPNGESPSSSASDVDNVNNPVATEKEKVVAQKDVTSSLVAGNHIISAGNRPNILRLLNFAQDASSAMEASRKSQIAFSSAKATLAGPKFKDVISSVKSALDFNFQDVEGLLQLVRHATEAIIRSNSELVV